MILPLMIVEVTQWTQFLQASLISYPVVKIDHIFIVYQEPLEYEFHS